MMESIRRLLSMSMVCSDDSVQRAQESIDQEKAEVIRKKKHLDSSVCIR